MFVNTLKIYLTNLILFPRPMKLLILRLQLYFKCDEQHTILIAVTNQLADVERIYGKNSYSCSY
jgi:hypothetical protein